MKKVKVQKVRQICNGYFKHKHHFKFTAMLCAFIQDKIVMARWHFYFLWIFKHWKLKKIGHVYKNGRMIRAARRRLQRGESAI